MKIEELTYSKKDGHCTLCYKVLNSDGTDYIKSSTSGANICDVLDGSFYSVMSYIEKEVEVEFRLKKFLAQYRKNMSTGCGENSLSQKDVQEFHSQLQKLEKEYREDYTSKK